jgi:hypothetical protein
MHSVERQTTFRRNISPLISGSSHEEAATKQVANSVRLVCSALYLLRGGLFLGLLIETKVSSEMLVNIRRTARRYFPEGGTLHNSRTGELKFSNLMLFGK